MPENIRITEPLGYLDMLRLMAHAKRILTDSGGVQKEAYMLGVPCITLRENTEWVETVEAGWNVLVGAEREGIVDAIRQFSPGFLQKKIFGEGDASLRIREILTGFQDARAG
ncbi:UDP-2,3-diacetamido-2,3-dideoxy-D-glucuronate 2-epimerase [anaerobic digester metagenome]